MLGTLVEYAEYIVSIIDLKDPKKNGIRALDFAMVGKDEVEGDVSLDEVRKKATGWCGVKVVDLGFNSCCMVLASGYYGGYGSALAEVFPDMDSDAAVYEIYCAIKQTLTYDHDACKETLVIAELA